MHGRLQGRLATAVRGFPCTPGISGAGLILRSLYQFAELIRDVSHGPGLSVEFLACRRTLFCAPAQAEAGRSAAPVVRSGMRLLLFAVLALGAYGQKRFPPDIVPQGWLDRRDPLTIDPTHYHLNFENAHVRAIRLTLKANEAVHMHDDVDALAVCIHECHLCFKSFNGRTQDVRMESGETRWFYGDTRSVCNLSARPMEMLFIEVKAASKDR